ncbi:MAG: PD-(D/E)XK nuclease family transposase [Treponema sp.]|jgi:predicted transposase/invertase (TIGR01784 family)|nr:PD-(D/E)XK nuclease family transposase [Treponema sp.]
MFHSPNPLINPCWDPVFKGIFTRDSIPSQIARKALLSALLERTVDRLSISANEPPVSRLGDRHIRYDINCTFDSGEKANIEMTLYPHAQEALRLEYYSARLFINQPLRGKNKSFGDLRRTYQISLLAHRKLFADDTFDHKFIYYDPERRIRLGGRTTILVLELEKLKETAGKPVREMTGKERWGIFFKYYTEPERQGLIGELMAAEEGIAMAGEMLEGFTAEEEAYFYELSKEKYELDMQEYETEAWKKGIAEGLEQGRTEGLERGRAETRREVFRQDLEAAQKMRGRGFSPDEIRDLLPRLTMEDILNA